MGDKRKEVIEVPTSEELSKRARLAVTIESECPVCGEVQGQTLDEPGCYLSYPRVGSPSKIWFRCGEEAGTDHPLAEWAIEVVPRMSLETSGEIVDWSTLDEDQKRCSRTSSPKMMGNNGALPGPDRNDPRVGVSPPKVRYWLLGGLRLK